MKTGSRAGIGAFAAALLFTLLFAARAAGDIVYLTDGTVVEGEVTDLGDSIKVRKTSGITVVYKKYQVRRIVKQVSKAEEYRKRKDALAEDDANGWLTLARWCVGKKLDTEAEAAYRAALTIASPVYRKARREYAAHLEKAGRLKEALVLYEGLGPKCAIEAGAVRAQLDTRRAGVYQKGRQLLAAREYGGAVQALEQAFRYTPPGGTALPGAITESEVVARLAEARSGLADSATTLVTLAVCRTCSGAGTGPCRHCGGRGKTLRDVMTMTPSGMAMQKKWMTCDSCRGAGKTRCRACSGSSVELEQIEATVRGTVRGLAGCAFGTISARARTAIDRVNRWVVGHPLAFGRGEAPYTKSRRLRELIGGVPATREDASRLESAWRGCDGETRANFLCSYGLELAKQLSTLPQSALKEDVLKDAMAPLGAEERRAPLVSAFPGEHAGEAMRVLGEWKGASAKAGKALSTEIDLASEGPHSLRPFVWTPAAKELHGRAGEALSLTGLSSRALVYPYADLQAAVEKRKPGDRVELAGRFYCDEKPSPRWRFEVWFIGLRPDEAMETAARLLSRKVTFRFTDTPLAAATEMLGELTGVKIELAVPRGVGMRVSARARKTALGKTLSQILGPLQLEWVFEGDVKDGKVTGGKVTGGKVRIVSQASERDRERTRAVLKLLP